jgi:hypothetical protein
MTKSNLEKKETQIPHPFSEKFMPYWEEWKAFKKETFKFNYKPIGEKHALEKLHKLSGGNESLAYEIVKEAMANGWKGFFELKNNNNGTNPKGFAPKPTPTGNVPAGGFGQF